MLNEIYKDYFAGRFDTAREKEQQFDNDYLPKALDHKKALAILLRIKHTPPEGVDAENQTLVSAQSIVAIQQDIGKIAQARDDQIRRLRKKVTGKLCLIGDTTTAGEDLKLTPIGPRVPGITINLAATNTMLTGRYLTVPRRWMSALLTLVLGVLFSWVFVRFHALVAFAAAAVGLPSIIFGHYQALVRAGVLISPVLPMVGVSVCYLTSATRRWWLDAEEKRKIRHAFQHYLRPVIVDKVSRNPELLRLGGEDAELTVLFSDIRGGSFPILV